MKKTFNSSEVKNRGCVYTPKNIVEHILNLSGYLGSSVIKKHVIDNSCGDGAFLVEVVKRYIEESLNNQTKEEIKNDLETYIHGIEVDLQECEKCKNNVSDVALKYGIKNVKWDINCLDALFVNKYAGMMSFVVGNPPYVRVHNLKDKYKDVKTFNFVKNGMTDLFIVFYEIGLNMLNKNGILGYITPSSVFNSLAGKDIRKHFIDNKLITKVVDFKHEQLFDVTTYSAILILSNMNKKEEVEYFEYDFEKNKINLTDKLKYENFYLNNNFYFSDGKTLTNLKNILLNKTKSLKVDVKNGFATLKDNFFIGEFDFKNFVIPIIKASTGQLKQCIFPYKNGRLVAYSDLIKNNKKLKDYFEENKELLENRSLEKKSDWYAFGRSQGILDVDKFKYSINPLIKDIQSIKLIPCKPGCGVYGGLYILTDIKEDKIRKLIVNEDFINYIKMLGKYKSGGYYTFSSDDLRKYLNFKLKNEDKNIEQLGIFGSN